MPTCIPQTSPVNDSATATQHAPPQILTRDKPATAEAALAQMTLDEKASLTAGIDAWHFCGVPRLGIPAMRVTDCGHGVTLCGEITSPATCFPTAIGMAATWNVELLERAGQVIGRETRALSCGMLLGPKVNLHRHPLNGRSYETFSEDPWLAGILGAGVIRGIQSQGVAACVKAMVANNQQRDQTYGSSDVDERTLREIYLRVFEIAVRRGQPSAIMTAYNKLNGIPSSESAWLIKGVIKSDWAFPGLVVSDWRAVHTQHVYAGGLDLEMPGPGKFLNRAAVLHALKEGMLTEADLDDKALRILRTLIAFAPPAGAIGILDMPAQEGDAKPPGLDTPENRALALEVAQECVVLLKNEREMLPINPATIRRILVTGPNAAEARLGGGGSAAVAPFYSISPLEGIREVCAALESEGAPHIQIEYQEGCALVGTMEPIRSEFLRAADRDGLSETVGLRAEFFNQMEPEGEPDVTARAGHIDYSWGWAAPTPGIRKGAFAVRYSGHILPPVTGNYRLGIYAQEGCIRVAIDGEVVVNEWDSDNGDGNFEAKFQTRYVTFERAFTAGRPATLVVEYGKRAAKAGLRLEWEIPGTDSPIDKAVRAAREADAVIVCAGLSNLFEGGGHDRSDIDLPAAQQRLIGALAAANPRTVVVLNNGGVLAAPWEPGVAALLDAWYPGQEGGRAIARILFGLANPSGRLPDTMPRRLEDHASVHNYPGDGERVVYEEGLNVGYRHFDAAGIEPHYPFGFGLSYTSFTISAPRLSHAQVLVSKLDSETDGEPAVRVTTTVRNTGPRAGSEVVQLYIGYPRDAGLLPRPVRELRAFRKVRLEPGETVEVSFPLGAEEFAHWDAAASAWKVAPGDYEILAGRHSRDLSSVVLTLT
ncbi:glycosyl hydrolase [Verrucomicrobia bacterium LW23]|nr:glycosyl hydrolase [Verrucomicrobia bacterium LW23]